MRACLGMFAVVALATGLGGGRAAAQTAVVPLVYPVHPVYPADGPLAAQVQAITSGAGVRRAHWGIAVTALDGTPLFGLHEGEFLRPASNMKLYTTAAAMALLKPETTYTTRIRGALDAHGTVMNDLVLVGGGDANFGTANLPYVSPALRKTVGAAPPALADLRAMVAELAAKGVKRVNGRVIGDDTLFPYEPFAGSWDVGDLVWGYGAPVSALTISDNALRLTVTPVAVAAGGVRPSLVQPTVALEQNGVAYYTVENELRTTLAGSGSDVNVERLPGSRVLRVYGSMAAGDAVDVEHVAIDDPALYAAMALRMLLVEAGIVVKGDVGVVHQPPGSSVAGDGRAEEQWMDGTGGTGRCAAAILIPAAQAAQTVLAEHVSAPLAADVLFTNKVSQNLHAEIFLHQLGHVLFCSDGSTAAGKRMLRAFAKRAGVDGDDVVLYDGSGLSSHDLVTPRATATLLAYAATQPWFAAWKASLPVGGEDGTLGARFGKSSPLKDHLFAKTGTLGESRALSGYLDAASGRTVVFSVMVDTHAPGGGADRVAMDAVIEAIAAAF